MRIFLTIFVLFALATPANAACVGGTCFWIGGAGTLNLSSDSAHWSITSGGLTCACEPATSDDIVFDGSSGGGTVTVTVGGGTWTANTITCGAFTGTLDFATSNNNVSVGSFSCTGSATRTLNLGNGTWSLTGGAALWNLITTTNLTFNANSSTIQFSGAASNFRRFFGGGLTYNVVSINSSANQAFIISGTNTIATLTISAPNRIDFAPSVTQTITTFTNISGSSGSEVNIDVSDTTSGKATISSANNWTCTWCGLRDMAFTGGGAFTATNSFDLGNNTGITITAPSAGSGGGSKIIGGGL